MTRMITNKAYPYLLLGEPACQPLPTKVCVFGKSRAKGKKASKKLAKGRIE
jgi:hypothetical protein